VISDRLIGRGKTGLTIYDENSIAEEKRLLIE
jgi:hypothetical protein